MEKIRRTDVWPARYKTGMWAWVLHRITGIVIVLYAIVHLWVVSNARSDNGGGYNHLMDIFNKPWVKAFELVLIAVIIYHALNGVRILLFDLGIGVKSQKQLFWAVLGCWAVSVAFAVYFLLPLTAK